MVFIYAQETYFFELGGLLGRQLGGQKTLFLRLVFYLYTHFDSNIMPFSAL